jgi:hypothetical protein
LPTATAYGEAAIGRATDTRASAIERHDKESQAESATGVGPEPAGGPCPSPQADEAPPTPSSRAAVRLGLLIGSYTQPAWAFAAVERCLREAAVRLVLVVLAPMQAPKGSPGVRLLAAGGDGLARAFDRLDARLFSGEPDAFAKRSIAPLVRGTAAVQSRLLRAGGRCVVSPEDVLRVRSANLDVLLYLGEERLFGGEILAAAGRGLWHLEHGSPPPYEGAAGGFWEVLAGEPIVRCTVKAASEESCEREVYTSFFATHLTSVARTRSGMYWTSAAFPCRALRSVNDVPEGELGGVGRGANESGGLGWSPATYSANHGVLRCLPSYSWRVARAATRKVLARRQWFVLVTTDQEELVPSLTGARRLEPPGDRFWADPHVVRRGGRSYVFVEELPFATGRGRIAVLVLDESGTVEGPLPVLERPYHLSYPFIFEVGGDLFMIPESEQNRTIELYRCVQFPTRWEFVKNLMENVSAVDSTLLQREDEWWLFTCLRETAGANLYTELCLFSSEDPVTGRWLPHPRNPVVSDERGARPAGPIFTHGGKLYRPAQYFVDGQGRAVTLKEITSLDRQSYVETEAGRLEPDWERGLVGTHTLTRAAGLIAVDAYRWSSRFVG